MSVEASTASPVGSLIAFIRRDPRGVLGALALLVAVGLALSTPLVGIVIVVALILAGLYVGGRSQIAAVVVYVLLLYVVSPRLALGVYEVTPALLAGLGCIVLWASGRSAIIENTRQGSPMTVVVIGYFCVVFLTYGLGLTRPLLAEQFSSADRNLVKLLSLVGVVLLIVDVVAERRQLTQVFGLIVAGGTFVGLAAIGQTFFDYDVVDQFRLPGFTDRGLLETGQALRLGLTRATGTARHPIEMATMVAMVLPIALHFVNYARGARARGVAMFSSVVLIVALLLSLSRSGYIGLLVVLVMLLPRWTPQRRFRFGVALVPAVFGIALLASEAFDAGKDLIANWSGDNIEASNLSARTEDYEIVREFVSRRPWFGQGFGTFTGDQAFAIDNQYLATLIETGFVGLIALVTLMFTGYGLTRRTYRHSTDERDRDLAASAGASIAVGIVSFGVFDAMSFDLTVASLFVMLGMVGAMHKIIVLRGESDVSEANPVAASELVGVPGVERSRGERS